MVDSALLMVSANDAYVNEVILEDPVIDYVFDDFLYICTANHFYKIDPSAPVLLDKTSLPLRFNYLMLKDQEIMLIATNEIIKLDRNNLAFKSGIGIVHGDNRPLIKNQSFAALSAEDRMYFISDTEARSTVRIVNRNSGRLIKSTTMDRVESFDYDPKSQSFIGLDSKNNILIYDMNMTRQRKITLPAHALMCSIHPDGFLVTFEWGLLLVNPQGRTIDFQPIPLSGNQNGSLFLSRNTIVGLDSTALRTRACLDNDMGIVRLYGLEGLDQALGIDKEKNIYLVGTRPLSAKLLEKREMQLTRTAMSPKTSDSLWYLQLGAFSNRDNALRMHDDLARRGLPVFIDSTDIYRVKFGGFADKFSGLEIAEKLNLNGWFVREIKVPGSRFQEFYIGTDKYFIQDGLIGRSKR